VNSDELNSDSDYTNIIDPEVREVALAIGEFYF